MGFYESIMKVATTESPTDVFVILTEIRRCHRVQEAAEKYMSKELANLAAKFDDATSKIQFAVERIQRVVEDYGRFPSDILDAHGGRHLWRGRPGGLGHLHR